MLVVNNTKNTVSSWGLVLKPGERKKIYGLVSRKAIKCSSLSFYPDDADEVSMIKYNYPVRLIIMSKDYNLNNKSSLEKQQVNEVKVLLEKLDIDQLKTEVDKVIEIKNSKGEVIGTCLPPDPDLPPSIDDNPNLSTTPVLPELPEQKKEEVKLEVVNNQPSPPPPPAPPKRRRGRRSKVTQLITDDELEKARLEALKLDAKLEAEESALQKTEN